MGVLNEKRCKKAYRTLALKHYPDKGGKVEKFRSVQEAYERLLRAACLGDHMRFARIDTVLETWRIVNNVINGEPELHPYFEGTWGPDDANEMIPGGWIDL